MIGGVGNPRGIIGLCFGYFRTGVSVFKLIDTSCMPISWRYYRPMRTVEVISASQCRWARIIASDRGVIRPFRSSIDPGLSGMMKTSGLTKTPIEGEMPAMPSSCPGTKAAARRADSGRRGRWRPAARQWLAPTGPRTSGDWGWKDSAGDQSSFPASSAC